MQLVERVELTSSQASITFSNIPQDGTDLYAVCSLRTVTDNGGVSWWDVIVKPNGSSANASQRVLYGNGSSATSITDSSIILRTSDGGSTANTFGNASIYIPNYTASTNKSISLDVVSESNETNAFQAIQAALWSITNSITSLEFTPTSGNLASGSSVTLYKITKGSDGTTTVA